jgi:hypothetical protein
VEFAKREWGWRRRNQYLHASAVRGRIDRRAEAAAAREEDGAEEARSRALSQLHGAAAAEQRIGIGEEVTPLLMAGGGGGHAAGALGEGRLGLVSARASGRNETLVCWLDSLPLSVPRNRKGPPAMGFSRVDGPTAQGQTQSGSLAFGRFIRMPAALQF